VVLSVTNIRVPRKAEGRMPGIGHDSTLAVDAVQLDQDLSANIQLALARQRHLECNAPIAPDHGYKAGDDRMFALPVTH